MDFGQPFGGLLPGAQGAVLSVLLRTGAPLTGRRVHGLVGGRYSLWSVQEALKSLVAIGLVETQVVGSAGAHTINEHHFAVPHLRALVDPFAELRRVAIDVAGPEAAAVILFGSVARGEATSESDLDLVVIAAAGWDRRADLEDAVRVRLGNPCDVLHFTPEEFDQLARAGEPVVSDIMRDGIALVGDKPTAGTGAT